VTELTKGALVSADEHVLTDRGGKLYGTHPALRVDHDKEMDVESATIGQRVRTDLSLVTLSLFTGWVPKRTVNFFLIWVLRQQLL
jgi:hypothetical protein